MKHDDLHLILRDHLALDRTRLANRRTMLAYLRTALMLLVSGATLVKVFHSEMVMIILACIIHKFTKNPLMLLCSKVF